MPALALCWTVGARLRPLSIRGVAEAEEDRPRLMAEAEALSEEALAAMEAEEGAAA